MVVLEESLTFGRGQVILRLSDATYVAGSESRRRNCGILLTTNLRKKILIVNRQAALRNIRTPKFW